MNYWRNWLRIILKINKPNLLIALVIINALLNSFSIVHAEQQEHRKAVIVIANFMNYEDFTDMTHVRHVMENGAVGLMNPRGASKTDNIRSYATLGWGSRADVLEEHSMIVSEGSFFRLKNIQDILKLNQTNSYNVYVGALGDFFHSRGMTTAVMGAYSTQGIHYMPGALIAADSKGMIDDAIVGDEIPDLASFATLFEEEYIEHEFIVLDLESIFRENLTKNTFNDINKFSKLQWTNAMMGQIVNVVDYNNTMLIVLSPYYSITDAEQGKKLPPIVLRGRDVRQGLLMSNTTRRSGIVGNIDLAPTIADYFGSEIQQITGEPIKVKQTQRQIEKITALYRRTAFNTKNRGIILQTYISIQIGLLLLTLVLLVIPKNINKLIPYSFAMKGYLHSVLRFSILFILVCPFSFFIMPLLYINNLLVYVAILVTINGSITYTVYKIFKNIQIRIVLISGITATFILGDLILNGSLNKTSILGYNAAIGARYYGLGNEYMGILIATILLTVVPLVKIKWLPRWSGVLVLIATIPIIGLSNFGANVGGTIAATIGFGFAILKMYKQKISLKSLVSLMIAVISVVALFAIYDIYFSPQKSHLARALIEFNSKGFDVVFTIIQRKLAMNLKLLKWTIWSRVLIVSIIVMIVLLLKPKGLLHKFLNKYQSFSTGWYAIIVASIVGMLVNDSGVVVAATGNIFLIFSLLYFILDEGSGGKKEWII